LGPGGRKWQLIFIFFASQKKNLKKKSQKKKSQKKKKKKILTVFGIVPVSYLSKFLKAWGHCYKTFFSP
jgi:hypothetical protein